MKFTRLPDKEELILAFIFIAVLYMATVSIIDRFSNPHLTETQLLLHYPNALILEFDAL
jgi:hypothetical protein